MACVGNRLRGDDAAGLEVARHLRGTLPAGVEIIEREGEPTALIDGWEGVDALWIVDAVSSGSDAGTVHRLDASDRALPPDPFRASTHHVEPRRDRGAGPRARAPAGRRRSSTASRAGASQSASR